MTLTETLKVTEDLSEREPIVSSGYECLKPGQTKIDNRSNEIVTTWDKRCIQELGKSILDRKVLAPVDNISEVSVYLNKYGSYINQNTILRIYVSK